MDRSFSSLVILLDPGVAGTSGKLSVLSDEGRFAEDGEAIVDALL